MDLNVKQLKTYFYTPTHCAISVRYTSTGASLKLNQTGVVDQDIPNSD